jgi:transcriptional repressor NrdR
MRCPFCDADKDSLKVIDSRTCEGGRSVRRRRQCLRCDKRFTTYERIEEQTRLIVIKRDGRRVPWDRGKILAGLERACFKRAVPQTQLQNLVDEVEEELFRTYDREVPSSAIGQAVIDRLRRLDQVAYVRFASVYRQFATLEELINEARTLLEMRRYETPGQQELFDKAGSHATIAASGGAPSGGAASDGDARSQAETGTVAGGQVSAAAGPGVEAGGQNQKTAARRGRRRAEAAAVQGAGPLDV